MKAVMRREEKKFIPAELTITFESLEEVCRTKEALTILHRSSHFPIEVIRLLDEIVSETQQ